MGSLVGQGFPAGHERGLHPDQAAANLDAGAEFAEVEGFGQVVVSPASSPATISAFSPRAVSINM